MNNNEHDRASGGDDRHFQIDTRGKRPAFFSSAETDALMTALLETMSQLWATRAQVRSLEQMLIDKGVITAEELDAFAVSPADKDSERQSMQDFFQDAFRAMRAEFQSVDHRQAEVDRFQNYRADTRNKPC